MEPKLKHYGGLNGLTGSKDLVINRNQDTACPGKFKWGANIMEMCAHPCYFLPVTSEGFQALFQGYRHSFMFQALFQGLRALFPAVGDAYSGVEWQLVHFILRRFVLSPQCCLSLKFQFVNHFTKAYACSILSNKVRGLISSAQFIVSMAD